MNILLVVAGVLTIVLAAVHSVLGEILILRRLKSAAGLPAIRGSVVTTRRTLRFTWHLTSGLALGIAAVFFVYGLGGDPAVSAVHALRWLSASCFGCFLIALMGSRAKHPSWIVLLAISIIVWVGAS